MLIVAEKVYREGDRSGDNNNDDDDDNNNNNNNNNPFESSDEEENEGKVASEQARGQKGKSKGVDTFAGEEGARDVAAAVRVVQFFERTLACANNALRPQPSNLDNFSKVFGAVHGAKTFYKAVCLYRAGGDMGMEELVSFLGLEMALVHHNQLEYIHPCIYTYKHGIILHCCCRQSWQWLDEKREKKQQQQQQQQPREMPRRQRKTSRPQRKDCRRNLKPQILSSLMNQTATAPAAPAATRKTPTPPKTLSMNWTTTRTMDL